MNKAWRQILLAIAIFTATFVSSKIAYDNFEEIWSDFNEFATVFIAALALITSVVLSYIQRKHNYRSTRPLLDFNYNSDESAKYMQVVMRNRGFGPALLLSYEVEDIDSKKIFNRNRDFQQFGNSCLGSDAKIGATFFEEGDIIGNNETETLISVFFEDHPSLTMQQVKNFVLGLKIKVVYSDIYDLPYKEKILNN